MVIVHQVQWPSFFYTLTRYWSAGFTCYLSLPKVCCVDVIWLCYRPKRDYTDLSSWRNWIFGSTFPPLVTLFLNLPSRLPPSRCPIGGRLGVRQWLQWNTADGSLRFRGCTRTGVNLTPQYLTANPNPLPWDTRDERQRGHCQQNPSGHKTWKYSQIRAPCGSVRSNKALNHFFAWGPELITLRLADHIHFCFCRWYVGMWFVTVEPGVSCLIPWQGIPTTDCRLLTAKPFESASHKTHHDESNLANSAKPPITHILLRPCPSLCLSFSPSPHFPLCAAKHLEKRHILGVNRPTAVHQLLSFPSPSHSLPSSSLIFLFHFFTGCVTFSVSVILFVVCCCCDFSDGGRWGHRLSDGFSLKTFMDLLLLGLLRVNVVYSGLKPILHQSFTEVCTVILLTNQKTKQTHGSNKNRFLSDGTSTQSYKF